MLARAKAEDVVHLQRCHDVLGLGPGQQQGDVARLERAPASASAAATTASSSTDETRTSGSTPAASRVLRRAGDAEARSRHGVG